VPSAEAADVRELGAVQDEIGAWVVPDSIPDSELDTFQPWWPKVPADLRDSTPRMLMTKNGRRIEGYVLGSDQGKGGDSTATSLIYVALPILGALTLLVSKLWAPLAILPALMTIPYLIAIAQGEKVKEAVKAGLLLYAAFDGQRHGRAGDHRRGDSVPDDRSDRGLLSDGAGRW
jgi:hypothetical protein